VIIRLWTLHGVRRNFFEKIENLMKRVEDLELLPKPVVDMERQNILISCLTIFNVLSLQ